MGQFIRFVFASCLGFFLALIVLFFVGSAIVAGIASRADKPKEVKANTVLYLTFDKLIPEKTNNLDLSPFDLQNRKVLGLREMLRTLEQAAGDDNVKGIMLELENMMPMGIAAAASLREALLDFQASGKFIVAYSKFYPQGGYYLASVADKIYLNPLGLVDFRGFAAQPAFFKKLLDKTGVDMEVFYSGQFKSATEPFRLTAMSEQSRLQTREYLEEVYARFVDEIGRSRDIDAGKLRAIANQYGGGMVEDALEYGLVDEVAHRDKAIDDIRRRLGLAEKDKIPLMRIEEYNRSKPPKENLKARDRIAVVFAEGSILDGKGSNGTIGDLKYTRIISRLRRDDRVKAIVLRVNSGGGSALASENIWRELDLAREDGKPVVVSMGDYAASGGYYIACMADSVFAEPFTLTGSIGVFNIIPNVRKLMGDKIGITFDSVKTGDFSLGVSPFFDMSEKEKRYLQARTDMMYETFLERVAKGRDMSRDEVHAIAQGRIWSGSKALSLGLIDRLGTLEDAIAAAARLSDLENYRVSEYPRLKDPIQELIEKLMGSEDAVDEAVLLRARFPRWYPQYQLAREILETQGAQARLPLVFTLD
jgi:protease-4